MKYKFGVLTIRNRDLPIPIDRPTPDSQEEDHDNNVPHSGIRCDIFDGTMIPWQSLTECSRY